MGQQWQKWWNSVMKIKNQTKKESQKKKKISRNQGKTESQWESIFSICFWNLSHSKYFKCLGKTQLTAEGCNWFNWFASDWLRQNHFQLSVKGNARLY